MAASPHTRRFYWAHHFVALPLALILTFYAGRHYAAVAGFNTPLARVWFTVALLSFLGLITLILLRQHYALSLQDRVIRLEVRQRYFELTGKSLRPYEDRLTLKQITVLRFAPDEQLPRLVEAAADQKLAPAILLEQIGSGYQADNLRV